jgi:hypothetical protein
VLNWQWCVTLITVLKQILFSSLRLKCDGTCAETRFRLSAKRTSPFKSAGGRQFSRLLAVEVCASAVVMLDTPWSKVVWRVLATHCIRQFPHHFLSFSSPCSITFQLEWGPPSLFSGYRRPSEGWDSVICTATLYGLIESRWGWDFPHPSRPALGPTQTPVNGYRVFPGFKAAGVRP